MNRTKTAWWRNRSSQVLLALLAIGGYFLWTEHESHVIAALPWLLVGGCLVMHLFMHGGHGHGGGRRGEDRADQGGKKS
jgi:hypothetical protein